MMRNTLFEFLAFTGGAVQDETANCFTCHELECRHSNLACAFRANKNRLGEGKFSSPIVQQRDL